MTDIDAIRNCFAHCGPENTLRVVTHEQRMGYALLAAYDAKCEELATSEREFQAMFKEAVKYKAERDAALTRISQLESRLRADLEHFRPLELGALSAFEQKYDALRAERDAAVRERDGLLAALKAIRDLRCSSFRTYEQDSKDMRRIAGDAIDAQLAALAPPTEPQAQPKVKL